MDEQNQLERSKILVDNVKMRIIATLNFGSGTAKLPQWPSTSHTLAFRRQEFLADY